MKKQYKLIGGLHHGEVVQVPDTADHLRTTDFLDSTEVDSIQNEIYVRRRLAGEEFGGTFECFAISTDDPIETEALALLDLRK